MNMGVASSSSIEKELKEKISAYVSLSKSIDQRVEYSTPYEWEDYIST
jgi:hypothetical protein